MHVLRKCDAIEAGLRSVCGGGGGQGGVVAPSCVWTDWLPTARRWVRLRAGEDPRDVTSVDASADRDSVGGAPSGRAEFGLHVDSLRFYQDKTK